MAAVVPVVELWWDEEKKKSWEEKDRQMMKKAYTMSTKGSHRKEAKTIPTVSQT